MAITYDYRYNQVGQALGAEQNTAESSVNLTGLTTSVEYQVAARQRNTVNGVVYLSTWGTANFTPVNTLSVDLGLIVNNVTVNAITYPVRVPLNTINHSRSVNGVSPFIPANSDYYDLSVRHVEGATTDLIAGLTTSQYNLTGLTIGDNYEVKVTAVKVVNSVRYPNTYSNTATFEAGAASIVVMPLDAVNPAVTVNPLTAVVSNPVVVNLGSVVHSRTIPGMTITVIVTLDTLTHTQVINDLTVFQAGVPTYSLRVTQQGGSTQDINGLTGNSYGLTGLTPDATYTVSVREDFNSEDHSGVTYFRRRSADVSFVSEYRPVVTVDLGLVTHSAVNNPLTVISADLIVTGFNFSNAEPGNFRVYGTISHPIQSITVTVDGHPMAVTFEGQNYDAELVIAALQVSGIDELDPLISLAIGGINLEVN